MTIALPSPLLFERDRGGEGGREVLGTGDRDSGSGDSGRGDSRREDRGV